LGITLASLGLGWLGEPFIARWLTGPLHLLGISKPQAVHSISYAVAFAVITFLHIVIGELAPKSLAIQRPRVVALWTAAPLVVFYYLFLPVIWVLNGTANTLLRWSGIPPASDSEHAFTPEELHYMLMHSTHAHPADELVNRLMLKALRSKETTAKEIMYPRDQVSCLWRDRSLEENLTLAQRAGYSRLPYCGDTLEEVLGVIHVKELLWQYRALGASMKLTDILHPVLTFTRETRLPAILELFQKSHSHLAAVVDDENRMLGIISFEDVLEELVGDIRDEFDIHKGPIFDRTERMILVDASLPVRDLAVETGWPGLPVHATETVDKWCLARWGRVPKRGENLPVDELLITAEEVTPRGLRRVRFQHQPRPPEPTPLFGD
ncbi:HlyC/CorC family transporter, partial [bacterium]|nr:HlyC/CorC family transporter [bacterium]